MGKLLEAAFIFLEFAAAVQLSLKLVVVYNNGVRLDLKDLLAATFC